MLKFLLVLILFSTAASAREKVDWQPLEVTVVEKEKDDTAKEESLQRSSRRFRDLMNDLNAVIEKRTADKNREVKVVNQETVYSAIADMIENSYPGGLEAMVAANEKLEDEIYRLLVNAPKYIYQYIGPFIHEMPYVSERILNIPGIKETKGKFPTRIAPQMQEYAKKYGKHMSTHLYIYLMPEAWASPKREKAVFKGYDTIIPIDKDGKPGKFFDVNDRSLTKMYKMPDIASYRTGKALEKIFRPQTPAEQVTETSPLTEGDVDAALTSFKNIEAAFGTNRFDDFHSAIRDMSLRDNNLMEEMLNPMQTLIDKIKRLPQKEKFEKVIAQNGFTLDSWGITVDKIIKARRVAKMTPGIALTLATWRKMKKPPKSFDLLSPHDKQVSWDSIQLFLGMYSSTQENLLAVKNYGDNIRKIFTTNDMMVLEEPVYGIY